MNKDVNGYINKQKSSQKEICFHLRNLIHKTLPGIKEEMKWGVPVFAGGKFYIGSLKDHVNLGFSIDGLTERERAFFEGNGKTMRHIKISKIDDIDKKRIAELLRMVDKKSKCDGSCFSGR